ncbi:MAG: hypothetical protein II627_00470, partial [Lachnospiraceae bacterium]|nr:hypothetical protein [Lachnospiraceae bacterium]
KFDADSFVNALFDIQMDDQDDEAEAGAGSGAWGASADEAGAGYEAETGSDDTTGAAEQAGTEDVSEESADTADEAGAAAEASDPAAQEAETPAVDTGRPRWASDDGPLFHDHEEDVPVEEDKPKKSVFSRLFGG